MGNLNAKVGKDNTNNDRAMGRHECGTMNENRERLVDFCNMNDLVIGLTLFEHCEIHKLTWCSPNGRDKNQIDHIMINGKWRCSLTDVNVIKGADVGSDHHLVTASIKLKLRNVGSPNKGHRYYDIDKLKSLEILKAFVLQLKNRFQALADLDEGEGTADEEINKK
ncbi:craniofacial development protein 2-like [Mauremys reevesii]|uniref:craniofacial development protein 2-like n=1 Tax=Mauremys reevesii TaxID=260615 RepID=UPI00193F3775|nr:craniofacial development protein 2-like [Mauremys reevesii]